MIGALGEPVEALGAVPASDASTTVHPGGANT